MFEKTKELKVLDGEVLEGVVGGCSEQCYDAHPPSNHSVWETSGPMAMGYSPRDYVPEVAF